MSRAVRDHEQIKGWIVWHLKELTGCSKVTHVKEISPKVYQAHCTVAPTKGAKATSLGYYRLDWTDPNLPKCERIGSYVS